MATGQIDKIADESGRAAQRLDAPLRSVESVVAAITNACAPVASRMLAPASAIGAFAADDISATVDMPAFDVALIDGRAFASADLIGASSLSPAIVMSEPPRVAVGDALPPGCDCVIEDDLVTGGGAIFEAHGGAAPGEGVRRRGDDAPRGATLVRAGERIGPLAIAAMEAARASAIAVRRPRVRVIGVPHPGGDDSSARMIASLTEAEGVHAHVVSAEGRGARAIADAFSSVEGDAVFIVGGAGAGADDHSIAFLREGGAPLVHGVALDPGRTFGAGVVDGVPVLCLPGRFDCALAAYLAFALPLLRTLAGARAPAMAPTAPLSRKIASGVGLSQIALLEASEDGWAPLAVGAITLSHLLRAQAWMIMPQASEGLPQGAPVTPHPLPGRSALS